MSKTESGHDKSSRRTTGSATPPNGATPRLRLAESALRTAESVLVQRADFAHRHGLSFPTSSGQYQRDLYKALGYIPKLKPNHYRARYERGGIAERIVEAYPNATWAEGAFVAESEDRSKDTPFETEINDLFTRLDLWERLNRADILAGLGRYSVLLLGAPGKLDDPLPRNLRATARDPQRPLAYIVAYDEDTAKIGECVDDPRDPRFGLPLFYNIHFKIAKENRVQSSSVQVHHTRVIHIAEGLLDSEIFGKPRLRSVWNNLDDLDKLIGGGAEAAWKRMDPGMQIDIDPEVEMTESEEDALDDEIDELTHGMRRSFRTRGAKVELLASQVAAFGQNATMVLKMISGATGIPQRLLLGSERGELASTQDRDNWADRVDERRRRFAGPLVRALVERLVEHGAVSTKPAEKIVPFVIWPVMEEMTEADKAKMTMQLAAANASMATAGGGLILSGTEIRDKVYGLPADDALSSVIPPKVEQANQAKKDAAVDTPETDLGS